MKLTPAQVQLAYDFLRAHPPFNGWRMPESQGIIFKHEVENGNYDLMEISLGFLRNRYA